MLQVPAQMAPSVMPRSRLASGRAVRLAGMAAWLAASCPSPAAQADTPPDWTYNMAISGWVTSNAGNRYHTFTPEAADRRAKEIADAGFKAAMTSGYHFRLNFAERQGDIRRIAGIIAAACHRHGLKVIEHHDWTIHFYDGYPLVFAHPDWLQLDAADMVTRHRIFCINNPDFQNAYLDYLRRYQQQTDTDAYQLDEIQYLERTYCGCRHCRAKFCQDTGRDYPPVHDPAFWERGLARADYREWMRWRVRSLGEFRRRMGEALRAIRPDVKMFNYSTMLQSNPVGFARGAFIEDKGAYDDTIGTEVNSNPFSGYPYIYATQKSRLALGESAGKPLVLLLDQTPLTFYFNWAMARSCRASLWGHIAEVEDGPPQETLIRWPEQMDDSVSRSAADIAVFLSGATRDLNDDPEWFFHEYEGWLQALCLSHNDARVLIENRLPSAADLSSLRLIVLPNAAAIAAGHAGMLLDYVRLGGRLLLTFESGTLEPDGSAKAASLLEQAGVRLLGNVQGKVAPDLGIPGEYAMPMKRIEPAKGIEILATASVGGEDLALLTSRKVGQGRIFYLAAKPGALAFETQQMPTAKYRQSFTPPADSRAIGLIGAIVDKVLEGVPRFRVIGAPRGLLAPIYATSRGGQSCLAVHLLNGSGRALEAGDVVAIARNRGLPMPPLPQFELELPRRVTSAFLATPEGPGRADLPLRAKGDAASVTIPAASFKTYALVYINQ